MNYPEALQRAVDMVKKSAEEFSKIYGISDIWSGHVKIVEKYAKKFAQMRGADIEVVQLSAILHDYGRYYDGAKYSKIHDQKGAELAKEFLKDVDISEERKENIYYSILYHDKINQASLNSLEGVCLADADAFCHIINCFEIYGFWLTIKKLGTRETLIVLYEKIKKSYNKMSDWGKEYANSTYNTILNYIQNALEAYNI